MKNHIPHSNPMKAPLTTEQSLFGTGKQKGIEFGKVTRLMVCSKCGKGGGTLRNIGTKEKPEYQHVGGC